MRAKALNFVAFQIAWFACILGAGNGHPWIGVLVVSISAALHISLSKERVMWVALMVLAIAIGFAFDAVVVQLGALSFPEHAQLVTLVPLWMLFMWVNFAFTLPLSLSWLKGRMIIAALFGLLGGPGAYYTGMKLDAVNLGDDLVFSLVVIGIEWAIATPLLVFAASRLHDLLSGQNSPDQTKTHEIHQ